MTAARPSRRAVRTRRRAGGFTLIELMITVMVLAVLTAIAVPTYGEYVARSRRADVRATLALGAQWMERFRAENRGVYTGAALPASLAVSPSSGTPSYDIRVGNLTATTWTLTATPRTGGPQRSDACGAYTLTQDGARTAAGVSSGTLYDRCWIR